MSRNNNGKGQKMDLRLNLSVSRNRGGTSSRRATMNEEEDNGSPNNSSSPSSCVSSEAANSPEAMSMVIAGCPRCLMYVMLAGEEPKCPKCNSPVLVDFNNGNNSKGNNNNNNSNNKKNKKSRA